MKDYFEVEKLANQYCENYGIEHLSDKYVIAVNAFCIGYRLAISKMETTTDKPYTALEIIENLRNASNPNARDPLEILAELRGTDKQGA